MASLVNRIASPFSAAHKPIFSFLQFFHYKKIKMRWICFSVSVMSLFLLNLNFGYDTWPKAGLTCAWYIISFHDASSSNVCSEIVINRLDLSVFSPVTSCVQILELNHFIQFDILTMASLEQLDASIIQIWLKSSGGDSIAIQLQ